MTNTRKSGLLLHPTSLPGRWGIGDLGAAAYTFVDFLASAGQQLWQVRGRAHQLEVLVRRDQPGDTLAEQHVVFSQRDADRVHQAVNTCSWYHAHVWAMPSSRLMPGM